MLAPTSGGPNRGTCRAARRSPRTLGRAGPSWIAAVLLVAVACGGDDSREAAVAARPLVESTAAVAPAADSGAPTVGDSGAPREDACPMVGLWRTCSVIERLKRSGLGTEPLADSVRQPGLTIAGSAYRVGDGELQLFLYADTADARREAAAVRPDDAEPSATRGILRPPAVIRSLNLVALLFNNNDRQLERVQLAITAGLPAS